MTQISNTNPKLNAIPYQSALLLSIVLSVSRDCNRFTLDAKFGDYFDGFMFRPHPTGGYLRCIEDSLVRINSLWEEAIVGTGFQLELFS